MLVSKREMLEHTALILESNSLKKYPVVREYKRYIFRKTQENFRESHGAHGPAIRKTKVIRTTRRKMIL